MTLAGVGPGDIVRVDGRYAFVKEKERGRLQVEYLHGSKGLAKVTARQVEGHWRRKR